jgi:diguanylate cyclase (GGDEF)-like protein/PAS domain S-box-containing protein
MMKSNNETFNESIRILIESAPTSCILLGKDVEIVECNQNAVSLFGATCKQDLLDVRIIDILPEFQRDAQSSAEHLSKMLRDVEREKSITRFLCARDINGDLLYLEATCIQITISERPYIATHLRKLGGDCVGCFNLMGNATLLQRLQEMLDNMPMMCNIFNKDFQLIDCNNKVVEFFKFGSKEEFVERFRETFPEKQPDGSSSQEKAREYISKTVAAGFYSTEWVNCMPDGELIPSYLTLVRFEWNYEMYVVSFVEDMRDANGSQDDEHSNNEKLQHILEASPLACFVTNAEFEIIDSNREFMKLLGISNKKITMNEYVFDFSPKYQPDEVLSEKKMKEMHTLALSIGSANFEWMHKTSSNELIPCELTLIRVNQGGGQLVMAYISDLHSMQKTKSMIQRMQQLEVMVYTDVLTGAHNRRYFIECAEREFLKCVNNDEPFSIIMLDIDFFKSVNDKFGHAVGDEVLKILVSRVCNVLKRDTIVARYGGEEFVVMLPNVGREAAESIAWRINKAIQQQHFYVDGKIIPITISLGVGTSGMDNGETVLDVINNADKALYAAKNANRNTVITYDRVMQKQSENMP